LAERLLAIYRGGDHDAAWRMRDRLLVASGVSRGLLERELIARDLLTDKQRRVQP
jgi:hypothetical protein